MFDASGYLDRALCKIFAVSLRANDANQDVDPPVIYLHGLAEVYTPTALRFDAKMYTSERQNKQAPCLIACAGVRR